MKQLHEFEINSAIARITHMFDNLVIDVKLLVYLNKIYEETWAAADSSLDEELDILHIYHTAIMDYNRRLTQ
jgi:hypothetical protein